MSRKTLCLHTVYKTQEFFAFFRRGTICVINWSATGEDNDYICCVFCLKFEVESVQRHIYTQSRRPYLLCFPISMHLYRHSLTVIFYEYLKPQHIDL